MFGIAGPSLSLLNAIHELDYPMIQLTVLVITAIFIVANLAADLGMALAGELVDNHATQLGQAAHVRVGGRRAAVEAGDGRLPDVSRNVGTGAEVDDVQAFRPQLANPCRQRDRRRQDAVPQAPCESHRSDWPGRDAEGVVPDSTHAPGRAATGLCEGEVRMSSALRSLSVRRRIATTRIRPTAEAKPAYHRAIARRAVAQRTPCNPLAHDPTGSTVVDPGEGTRFHER